ncbi:MAG: DUF429 domain-containing protein [Myxococcota bacterium]
MAGGRWVGVDGWRGGWVAVALTARGVVDARSFSNFTDLVGHFDPAEVIAVDMPVGLRSKGSREADAAARAFLRGQASSVFSAPPRPVLSANDYPEAARVAKRLTGKGMSKQAFHLLAKIREVDPFASEGWLYETHPEVSFRLMNQGPLRFRKKTFGGVLKRRELLEAAGIRLDRFADTLGSIGVDDVLDAGAAAWSARRIGKGTAQSFPTDPRQQDRSGRRLAIWA